MNATNTLLDYMQDKRDDIIVVEKVNGNEREIFDERETLHMVDVKNLYLNAMKTRTILLVGSITILTLLAFTHRNQKLYNPIKCISKWFIVFRLAHFLHCDLCNGRL